MPEAKPFEQPTATDEFLKGLWSQNPVLIQVLGMCPVLAVSNTAVNALSMGLATTFVMTASCVVVSLMRRFVPREVRIVTFILVIATFVTIVDYLIQAISLELHRALGAFISLIVVNCLILGRAEVFASRNGVMRSLLDAGGMGIGFTAALLCLGSIREVLGSGSWFGVRLFGDRYQEWVVMVLPAGGFFTLAGILIVFNWWNEVHSRRRKESME